MINLRLIANLHPAVLLASLPVGISASQSDLPQLNMCLPATYYYLTRQITLFYPSCSRIRGLGQQVETNGEAPEGRRLITMTILHERSIKGDFPDCTGVCVPGVRVLREGRKILKMYSGQLRQGIGPEYHRSFAKLPGYLPQKRRGFEKLWQRSTIERKPSMYSSRLWAEGCCASSTKHVAS